MSEASQSHPPATQLVLDRLSDLKSELEEKLEAVHPSFCQGRKLDAHLRSAAELLPWVLGTALLSALLTCAIALKW
jgi:hypothetical protein